MAPPPAHKASQGATSQTFYSNEIEDVNAILKRIAMKIIGPTVYTVDNSNIDYTCMDRRGLHLNIKMAAQLLVRIIAHPVCLDL